MRQIAVLLVSLFFSSNVFADCVYLESDAEILAVNQLKRQAAAVLDAEGKRCEKFEEGEKKESCLCKFREFPLIPFKASYRALIEKNPEFDKRMVCYSVGERDVSVNFVAYGYIASWCE